MITLRWSFLLIAGCLLIVSCSSSRYDKKERADVPKIPVPLAGETIPPNTCRLVATVISIDPTLKSENDKDPCSKAPCFATVRVDSVLGYGAAFAKPLAVGNTIPVTFAFTTAPTKDIVPSLSQTYPGVAKGTTFSADVISQQGFNDEVSFRIYGYKVK